MRNLSRNLRLLLRVVWVGRCLCVSCLCVCVQHCICTLPRYACLLACLHIYTPFCRSETPPRRPRTCCTLYEARSRAASGNVGVDALRHAWRDCAKGSHFNHCSRACVGCSHEVKRVRRPLFFFWQMTGEMTTFTYCTVPPGYIPPYLAPTYGEKIHYHTCRCHCHHSREFYYMYLHHLFQND